MTDNVLKRYVVVLILEVSRTPDKCSLEDIFLAFLLFINFSFAFLLLSLHFKYSNETILYTYISQYTSFPQLWMSMNLLPKTRDMIAINFIRMFRDGPDVSFKGSPTVSPTTAAL